MTSVGSNFLCGRPHGAYLPVRRRPPEPGPLPPPCGRHKWMAPVTAPVCWRLWRNYTVSCKIVFQGWVC